MCCRFSFLTEPSTEAKILQADEELNPASILLMTAEPAGGSGVTVNSEGLL
jgi:hypothetical protein